jgi:hypothetical protein
MINQEARPKTEVEVTANYLPSPAQFRQDFQRTDVLGLVRTAIMLFFGVQDRTDGRRTYTYYLTFEGQRQDDLNSPLSGIVGTERHTAHFQLVEQIQEG